MHRSITALFITTLVILGVSVLSLTPIHVSALATLDNPANTQAQANCDAFENPTQITSGKDKGKWWCQPKQAGGNNNGTPSSDSTTGADASASGATGNDANGSGSVNTNGACSGLDQLGGASCGSNAGQSAVGGVANRVVTIISYIAGIIAIIMVIISGVRYTTSGGDSAKVGAAKTALVFALVGIGIAALAQVLVHFVLNQASGV